MDLKHFIIRILFFENSKIKNPSDLKILFSKLFSDNPKISVPSFLEPVKLKNGKIQRRNRGGPFTFSSLTVHFMFWTVYFLFGRLLFVKGLSTLLHYYPISLKRSTFDSLLFTAPSIFTTISMFYCFIIELELTVQYDCCQSTFLF